MSANRRSANRSDACRVGTLTHRGQPAEVDCLVWDTSGTGAQVEVEEPGAVPDMFTLMVTSYARPRDCIVVWRDQRRLGVAFID